MKTKVILLLGGLALQGTAHAQAKGGAGSPAPSSSAPANPEKYINPDWNAIKRSGRVGDYLSGEVTVAGGALPWDPIPVTVTCDGKVRYTTNTDPKGGFAIAPKEPQGSKTIKADPKPLAAQFVGCGVEAALPGFSSTSLTIANRDVWDSPMIGTITLTREDQSQGAMLSSTSAAAPTEATRVFQKARSEWLDNKADKAKKDLQKAVEVYPQYSEAWYQLGKIQEGSKAPQDALNSFSKAVAADPKFSLPYVHIAALFAQNAKWQETVDATTKDLELNPRGTIDIWYYNALGNFQLQKMDAAETSATKALAMDPLHSQPNTEQLLAVILAQKQDLAGALQHLKNCLTYFEPGPSLDLVKQQIAQLEPAVSPQ